MTRAIGKAIKCDKFAIISKTMKKSRFICRTGAFMMLVAAAGILLVSCVKGGGTNYMVSNAALKVVNLAPDQPAVIVNLSGNALTNSALAYGGYTASYLNFAPGVYTVTSVNAGNTLASVSYNFLASSYYSLFVTANNNSFHNVISNDTFNNFITGQGNAYIRYVNAISDTVNNARVNVTSGTTSVFGDNASFGTVSGFKAVAAGTVNVRASSTAPADTSGSFVVTSDYAYTILLSGVPGSTDVSKRVQIRMLENGSLAK